MYDMYVCNYFKLDNTKGCKFEVMIYICSLEVYRGTIMCQLNLGMTLSKLEL